jgi:threonine/homoserine/homoserine lactone efflux protein
VSPHCWRLGKRLTGSLRDTIIIITLVLHTYHRQRQVSEGRMNNSLLIQFVIAAAVISVIPGPDQLFIVATAATRGARAGLAAAFGMASGMVVHTTLLALGLAALLRSAPDALVVVRMVGACYLMFLAVHEFRAASTRSISTPDAGHRGERVREAWLRGMLTNLANPKVVLFYIAFLPQFVDERLGHVTIQLVVLGAIFLLLGLAVDLVEAALAGRLGALMRRRLAGSALGRIIGSVYAILATRLALAR